MNRLMQLLNIKQGEGRIAARVIGIMLFTAAGFTLGNTAIETLFLKRYGVQYLPYMFLGLGVTNMVMSFGITAFLSRVPRVILYVVLPIFMAVLLIVGRLALLTGSTGLYPFLWLGKEVFNSLTGLLVWGVAGYVCDVRQTKRLFPLFNASRILGEVIGGLSAGALVKAIGTENLIAVWAGAALVALALIWPLLQGVRVTTFFRKKSRRKPPSTIQEIQRGFQYVRNSRLMKWVSFAAILFSILYFSISLPFSRVSSERFTNEADLAAFLGLFTGTCTAVAFLVSLFVANRFFVRFGIMIAILCLPLVYLGGFTAMVISPVFLVVAAFRFMQMVWLSGMADPAYQAMFNVAPPERRDQVRAFIDGIPSQAGTFIAGGLLIVGEQFLTPQQASWIGFGAAVLCTIAIWNARRGYNDALMDAVRSGQTQLFTDQTQSFSSLHTDASTLAKILKSLNDKDPAVRRSAVELLGYIQRPETEILLLNSLKDSDPQVRAASLKSLTTLKAESAFSNVAASLADPEADVRVAAISSVSKLAPTSADVLRHLRPLLKDRDPHVSASAALILLKLPSTDSLDFTSVMQARKFLREMAESEDSSARVAAITALGELKNSETFDFLEAKRRDAGQSAEVVRAILISLGQINSKNAQPHLIESLGHHDPRVRDTAAMLLAKIGEPAALATLLALKNPLQEDGALDVLYRLPFTSIFLKPIEEYVRFSVERAERHENQMRQVKSEVQNEAGFFLANELHIRSRQHGIQALQGVGLLENREAMALAVDSLRTGDQSQKAMGLEIVDELSEKWRSVVRPLMSLWEDVEEAIVRDEHLFQTLLNETDPWLRACAAYTARRIDDTSLKDLLNKMTKEDEDALVRIAAAQPAGGSMETYASLSVMDRILFFKRVSLFENLSPADLKQVASIAQEEVFADGDVLAEEGEQGDVMFVIVSGKVHVTTSDQNGNVVELAIRNSGDYVGEMSLINREPRTATLTAIGEVRALCLDQKAFTALLQERPAVGMSVIRVLSKRLNEANTLLENLSNQKMQAPK